MCFVIVIISLCFEDDNIENIEEFLGIEIKNMVYNGYKVIDVDNDENFDNSYELETGGNLDIYYFCVGQADCILLTNDGENIEINKLDINLDGNENRILFN